MSLIPHCPRPLSPLEWDAFQLVFWNSINPNHVRVQVHDRIEHAADPGGVAGTYSTAENIINIAADKHRYTDPLNSYSTRRNTDIFKPGNMFYLNTFIHEMTHLWQHQKRRFIVRAPRGERTRYDFSRQELLNLSLWKEQHASAVAAWFVLGWQLRYKHLNELINLTRKGRALPEHVGKVTRYHRIREIPTALPKDPGPRGLWIIREEAIQLHRDFAKLLNNLRFV